MIYKFSQELSQSKCETEGLCDGLAIRKHLCEDLEEIGTFRAQQDWNDLVSKVSDFKGGLGPEHSFMAVSLPECLPDRLEVVSYANEFAFLHDGMFSSSHGNLYLLAADVTDVLNQEEVFPCVRHCVLH